MHDKYKPFWEKIAEQLKPVWKDIIQIAVYNTGLDDKGNLVVVIENDSIEEIVKAHKIVKEIYKKKMPAPLIVSPHYIEHSLDSFPLEFLNIKSDYYNLYATKDVFKDIQFDKSYIRLEMERELKSKELLIKMTILDYYGKTKILKELITVSIKSIEPVLKGLLFLLGESIPKERPQLINKADEVTDFDISSLLIAVQFAEGKITFSKNELSPFFYKYTKQLQILSDYIEMYQLTNE